MVMLEGKPEGSSEAGGTGRHEIPEELRISVGSLIGEQYEVRRVLGGEGKSGMGVVYVCYDRRAQQMYALKTFQDRFLYSNKIKDNFLHEALAWVLLDAHPNIVQAVSVEAIDNRLFIVLEYIEPDDVGRNTLTHYLRGPIAPTRSIEWALQFCDGMAYAASHGVTPHRDIKPDNLMIARDGTLKITDLGLARFWEGTLRPYDLDECAARPLAGTYPWMAPEQFEGRSDMRSDIYSFGIVLYQMASGGKPPFMADSMEGYRQAHKASPVPGLYSRLFPIIGKCLKKSPEERYGDFRSLRADLEKLYISLAGTEPPAPSRRIEPGVWEYNNKALALYNVGLVDEAIWLYRKALRVDPAFVEQHTASLAMVHNNLGVAYDARGEVDMAIGEYKEALRLNPYLADAYNNMGTALRAKGMVEKAMREYRHALSLKPDHAMARHNLGLSYACRGAYEAAIGEYAEAIRLNPGFVEARINLGLAHAMSGRLDAAIAEYRKAAQLRPDGVTIHYNLARALHASGEVDGAIAEYRIVLALEPGHTDARCGLALSLEGAGRLEDAINEYIGIVHLEPRHEAALSGLERALRGTGASEPAVEECLRILSGRGWR